MAEITVEYYAVLRDEVGKDAETLSFDGSAAELYDQLKSQYNFSMERDHLRVAMNEAFVPWDSAVEAGATVVFIPPVSGGAGEPGFTMTTDVVDPPALTERFRDARAGAFVTFEGWVRDHNEGKSVEKLSYQAYEAMANTEGRKIVAEAEAKFEIYSAYAVHRHGDLGIGDVAVFVGVNSAHRREAFEACQYIIDEVKGRVPIWKKEHYVDGNAEWVACHRCAEHAHAHAGEHTHEHSGCNHQH